MSAYVMAYGYCISCGKFFGFCPTRVPSVRVDGSREPVCQPCVEGANVARAAKGLEPIIIRDGAYEAVPEEEVIY